MTLLSAILLFVWGGIVLLFGIVCSAVLICNVVEALSTLVITYWKVGVLACAVGCLFRIAVWFFDVCMASEISNSRFLNLVIISFWIELLCSLLVLFTVCGLLI